VREAVSRTLHDLRSPKNLETGRRRIVDLDPDALPRRTA
jgi:hypothetical protein